MSVVKDSFTFPARFIAALRAEVSGAGASKSGIIFEEVGKRLARSEHVRRADPEFRQWFKFKLMEKGGQR